MGLVNLQIKVYPETESDFVNLMAESDTPTKGKFLELLIENYRNPRKLTVEKDTPETTARLAELQSMVENLEEQNQSLTTKANSLAMYRDSIVSIMTILEPYLLICQRDGHANDLPGLVSFMLKTLQRGRAFILETTDLAYIAKVKEGRG